LPKLNFKPKFGTNVPVEMDKKRDSFYLRGGTYASSFAKS